MVIQYVLSDGLPPTLPLTPRMKVVITKTREVKAQCLAQEKFLTRKIDRIKKALIIFKEGILHAYGPTLFMLQTNKKFPFSIEYPLIDRYQIIADSSEQAELYRKLGTLFLTMEQYNTQANEASNY